MGKSSPKQPDTGAMMSQQSALNRLNQYTPFGNIEYYGDRTIRVPDGPDIHGAAEGVRVNLSPEQQQLLQQQQQAQSLLGQRGIQLAGQFPGDFDRSGYEQAQFQRAMSLMNPQFDLQEERMQQRLANQGLPQASRAYTSETGRFQDSRNQAMEQAALAAVMGGGQEMRAQRGSQLQEILGLFGLQPVQVPQMMNAPQIDVPVQAPQQAGLSPFGAAGMGALSGAAAGSPFGPWGAGIGAGLGGLFGLGSVLG